jgi:hypothetical protein
MPTCWSARWPRPGSSESGRCWGANAPKDSNGNPGLLRPVFAVLPGVVENNTMQETQVLDRQGDSKAGLSSPSQSIARRILKIESLGDPWRGKRCSSIRLKGHWLVRAGFHPGQRVKGIVASPSSMQLRAVPEPQTAEPRVAGQGVTSLVGPLLDGARAAGLKVEGCV